MLFNSVDFVVFFVVVFAAYWLLPFRWQNWLLLAGSYVFYGWWGFYSPELSGIGRLLPLGLLAVSTCATWWTARRLAEHAEGSQARRWWFLAGLLVNVGMLGYFKYRGFFMENVQAAASVFGWVMDDVTMNFLLPAGISFYTFQGLAYLIDVHGGAQTPVRRLPDFALFHAFFPQLVAGPIERTPHLLPQLTQPRTLTPERLWTGLQLIIVGFVKKIAIADAIAPVTNDAFFGEKPVSGLGMLFGVWLFALQIYGDFSGYSDIARGSARLLGVELSVNFRQPYFARNITEFWERWHVTLSTWLRDYLFVPLCRRFRGKKWIYPNLMATMLISGVWHGASWNFVIWGVLLGAMLVIHKLWAGKKSGKHPHRPATARQWLVQVAGMLLTFQAVCLTLVFVKTKTLTHAWECLQRIAGGGTSPEDLIPGVYVLFYGLVVVLLDAPAWWKSRDLPVAPEAPAWRRGLVYGMLLLFLAFVGEMESVSFVYFQF